MRLRNLKPYKLNRAIIELDDERNQFISGYEEIETIHADIQPANGKLAIELYGLEITKYKTVFMYHNDVITEGLFIEVDGKQYAIQPIQKWHNHLRFDVKGVE